MQDKINSLKRFFLFLIIPAFFLFPKVAHLATIDSAKLIDLTNQERLKNNLEPLKVNSKLTKSATAKLLDMFDGQYFEHNTPDGEKFSKFVTEEGYDFLYTGENLAINFTENKDVIEAWLESPTHKRNLLSRFYDDIGIAAGKGYLFNNETIIIVQHFGKTYPNLPASSANLRNIKGDIVLQENQIKRPVPFFEEYEENIIPQNAGLLKNIKGKFTNFKKTTLRDPLNIFTLVNVFLVLISSLILLHLFILSIKLSHKKIKNKKYE